jgi:hypothetical protein
MKDSTATSLMSKRDNLQRMLMLQREVITQKIGSNPQPELDSFPRSNTMRFIYSAKGLLLAQMIFNQVIRHHPRTMAVIKTFGQLLLRNPTKSPLN